MMKRFPLKDLDCFPALRTEASAVWIGRCRELCPEFCDPDGEWLEWPSDSDDPWSVLRLQSRRQGRAVFVSQVPPDLSKPGLIAYVKRSSWLEKGRVQQLESLFLSCALGEGMLDRASDLLRPWMCSGVSYEAMEAKINLLYEGRVSEEAARPCLFPRFAIDPVEFALVRDYWQDLASEFTERDAEVWQEWREPHESGNPILCLWSRARRRAVRIVQREDHSWQPSLDAWFDTIDYEAFGGPEAASELTISAVLTEETAEISRQLLFAWVQRSESVAVMEPLIDDVISSVS